MSKSELKRGTPESVGAAPEELRPRLLAVGGLDPSGAAGLLADVKVAERLGVYACGVATAVTAQNQHGVSDMMPLPASLVGAQIDAVLADAPCEVFKSGMLATVDTVHAVADRLGRQGSSCRLVLDPVLASTTGRRLLDDDGRRALVERLLPMAALVTPNLDEAEILVGRNVSSPDEANWLIDALLALGASAVLLKGGHWVERADVSEVTDVLRTADGEEWRFSRARIPGAERRGTGCALGSAVAAGLAEGLTLHGSVQRGTDFLAAAMADNASVRQVRALNFGAF